MTYIEKALIGLEEFHRAFRRLIASDKTSLEAGNLGINLEKLHFTSRHQDHILPEDRDMEENSRFTIPLVRPERGKRGLIVLGHGLNEGDYTKILPWMYTLAVTTGYLTTVFPMSFHLNRRPRSWIKRSVVAYRKRSRMPENRTSSPMNAVLSERLHSSPERFIAAARQSRRDFIDLLKRLKESLDGPIHFLGYSLAGFAVLSIIGDESLKDLTKDSKAVIFCSGSSLLKSDPESPLILDRLAVEATKGYIKNFKPRGDDPTDIWFNMLIAGRETESLRKRIGGVGNRLLVIAGENDRVTPLEAIEENLGIKADLVLPLGIHEVPFNASEGDLNDLKSLHARLKTCYMVDKRFRKTYIRFTETCTSFLSDEKWV